jgi:branched-chain amino acid transport system permease protein
MTAIARTTAQERRTLDPAAIAKDTILTAIIALAIFGPIVGLKTIAIGNGLALQQRWGLVAVLVAIVAAGRMLLNIFVWSRPQQRAGSATSAKIATALEPLGKYLGIAISRRRAPLHPGC